MKNRTRIDEGGANSLCESVSVRMGEGNGRTVGGRQESDPSKCESAIKSGTNGKIAHMFGLNPNFLELCLNGKIRLETVFIEGSNWRWLPKTCGQTPNRLSALPAAWEKNHLKHLFSKSKQASWNIDNNDGKRNDRAKTNGNGGNSDRVPKGVSDGGEKRVGGGVGIPAKEGEEYLGRVSHKMRVEHYFHY